jgi:hypothetical protein
VAGAPLLLQACGMLSLLAIALGASVGPDAFPFSHTEVQKALSVGVAWIYRVDRPGAPPQTKRVEVLGADAKKCRLKESVSDEAGAAVGAPVEQDHPWEHLAKKPIAVPKKARVVFSESDFRVGAERLDVYRYRFIDGKEKTDVYFAKTMPGLWVYRSFSKDDVEQWSESLTEVRGAVTVTRADPSAPGPSGSKWSPMDSDGAAEALAPKLIAAALAISAHKPPALLIRPLADRTSEHVMLTMFVRQLQAKLLQDGRVDVVEQLPGSDKAPGHDVAIGGGLDVSAGGEGRVYTLSLELFRAAAPDKAESTVKHEVKKAK